MRWGTAAAFAVAAALLLPVPPSPLRLPLLLLLLLPSLGYRLRIHPPSAYPPFPPSVCPHAHLHLSTPTLAFICACSCLFMPIQLRACFCWSPLPGCTRLAFIRAHLGSFVLVPTI